MDKDKLLNALGEIKDEYIHDAAQPGRIRFTTAAISAAACLCMVVLAAVMIPRIAGRSAKPSGPQLWSSAMTAADYFKNSKKGSTDAASGSSSDSLVMGPAALQIDLRDMRSEFENEGIIPVVSDHPEHDLRVEYNGDGSLYKITFWWMRRGESLAEYSDLRFTAAPKQLHEISDVIYTPLDPDGYVLPPYVTETVRDGISILAEGRENESKTLTWQTEAGWFRLYGSRMDSYESMIELLDRFWENPLDLNRFAAAPEGSIIYSTRVEYPYAFADQIPDFASLGYTAEYENVNAAPQDSTHLTTLYNGELISEVPIYFDGVYVKDNTRIRWTINTGADADSWHNCIGRPAEITEAKLTDALAVKNYVNIFFNLPCMATLTVEQGTAGDAWEIIETMR